MEKKYANKINDRIKVDEKNAKKLIIKFNSFWFIQLQSF